MAVDYAHVFSGFLAPVRTQISFQKHRLLFSHSSAEVRGENTPERKFNSTRYRTHNHPVRSPTHSPLSTKPSGRIPVKRQHSISKLFPKQSLVFTCVKSKSIENTVGKGEIVCNTQFLLFPQCFQRVWRTFCYFYHIQTCNLQTLSVWKSLKIVAWERVI